MADEQSYVHPFDMLGFIRPYSRDGLRFEPFTVAARRLFFRKYRWSHHPIMNEYGMVRRWNGYRGNVND